MSVKLLHPEHPLLPAGYKKFRMTENIQTTICPGCGKKNCGIVWFGRKKNSDPCTGETICGKAKVWHDWNHTKQGLYGETYGFDYFYKPIERCDPNTLIYWIETPAPAPDTCCTEPRFESPS